MHCLCVSGEETSCWPIIERCCWYTGAKFSVPGVAELFSRLRPSRRERLGLHRWPCCWMWGAEQPGEVENVGCEMRWKVIHPASAKVLRAESAHFCFDSLLFLVLCQRPMRMVCLVKLKRLGFRMGIRNEDPIIQMVLWERMQLKSLFLLVKSPVCLGSFPTFWTN